MPSPITPAPLAGGPPPRPPLDKLPEPLRDKLLASYEARRDGAPGSERNLFYCYDKGANVWDAIHAGMSWQDINTMTRVYQRIEAVDRTGRLWRDHIRYIISATTGTIYYMSLVYTDDTPDRAALTAYLDEISRRPEEPRLARERGLFQILHHGTTGWRQVSLTDQLHISVADGTAPGASEDIHIDETSFTHGRDASGSAVAAPMAPTGLKHLAQSLWGLIEIERPFDRLKAILTHLDALSASFHPETLADLREWSQLQGDQAVSGELGHARAVSLSRRARGELRRRDALG